MTLVLGESVSSSMGVAGVPGEESLISMEPRGVLAPLPGPLVELSSFAKRTDRAGDTSRGVPAQEWMLLNVSNRKFEGRELCGRDL